MFQGNKKRLVGESRKKTKFVESRRTFPGRMINTQPQPYSSNTVFNSLIGQPIFAQTSSFLAPKGLEELNKLIPNPRPLPHNPKLTILAISGQSQQGKTSLCKLLSDNSDFKFISMDLMIINIKNWCTNPLILKHDYRPIDGMFVINYNKYINDTCAHEFIEELFSKIILDSPNKLILIEGQFFTYSNNTKQFALACKRYNIRLWFTERLA